VDGFIDWSAGLGEFMIEPCQCRISELYSPDIPEDGTNALKGYFDRVSKETGKSSGGSADAAMRDFVGVFREKEMAATSATALRLDE
jgi:hypothetical protein